MSETGGLEACKIKVFPPAFWPIKKELLYDRSFIQARLLLDSGVLADQQLNERTKQRFASLADVVNKLEETQVEREFLL